MQLMEAMQLDCDNKIDRTESKLNRSCVTFSTEDFVKKVVAVVLTILKITAKSILLQDVMTHGVKNGTGQFASIGFKEAASLSKPVNFYISKGWMTAVKRKRITFLQP